MTEFEVASRSLLGSREEQQDSFDIITEEGRLLAVICDGMGGHSGGALASQTAVRALTEAYRKERPENMPAFFVRQTEQLNRAVCDIRGSDGKRLGAGTTIVAASASGQGLYWLSVGDSRLYLYRSGQLTQITEDHNFFLVLEEKLRAGEMTRKEYEEESKRGHSLISCLGMKKPGRVNMNLEPLALYDGDVLLLMSDGLYKAVGDASIAHCIDGSAEQTAQALGQVLDIIGTDGLDNTTFIIVKIHTGRN